MERIDLEIDDLYNIAIEENLFLDKGKLKYNEKIFTSVKEYIMDERKGTYLSSIDVIDKLKKINGYFYIAHINTSDIFKKIF